MTCSIPGCGREARARGLCHAHHKRWCTHGDVRADVPIRPLFSDPEDAFAARTERDHETGCLIWTGGLTGKGYGSLWIEGKWVRAHRYAWEREHGVIPEGLHVLHQCDTPACCEVEHLFLGTHTENMADRDAKERQVRGEAIRQAKLTEAEVLAIFADPRPHRKIAVEYGVAPSNVGHIKTGKTWAWLTGQTPQQRKETT